VCTGYIIDCVDYTIMFVEGIHNALRTKLAGHFIEHEPTILYDRTMIFEKVWLSILLTNRYNSRRIRKLIEKMKFDTFSYIVTIKTER